MACTTSKASDQVGLGRQDCLSTVPFVHHPFPSLNLAPETDAGVAAAMARSIQCTASTGSGPVGSGPSCLLHRMQFGSPHASTSTRTHTHPRARTIDGAATPSTHHTRPMKHQVNDPGMLTVTTSGEGLVMETWTADEKDRTGRPKKQKLDPEHVAPSISLPCLLSLIFLKQTKPTAASQSPPAHRPQAAKPTARGHPGVKKRCQPPLHGSCITDLTAGQQRPQRHGPRPVQRPRMPGSP